MRMMKYFAILMCATLLYAKDTVQYDLDYGDSISVNVSYLGANTNLILIGYDPNKMHFVAFDSAITAVVGKLYVSKPSPDWSGAAVSNLNMGGKIITNVSSLFSKNILLLNDLNIAEDGGIYSLGRNGGSSTRYITSGSYGSGFLGCFEGTSEARIDNSRGAGIFAYMNSGLADITSGAGSYMLGYLNTSKASINGLGSFMPVYISGASTVGLNGNGSLIGGVYDSGYAFTNYGGSSFGWGRNIKNTNVCSVLFGDGVSSVLDYNSHAQFVYLFGTPTHTNQAVPMWWVKQNWTNIVTDDRYVNRYAPNFAGPAVSNLNMGFNFIYNPSGIVTRYTELLPGSKVFSNSIFSSKIDESSPFGEASLKYIIGAHGHYSGTYYTASIVEIAPTLDIYGNHLTNKAIVSLNPKVKEYNYGAPFTEAYITANSNTIREVWDPSRELDVVNLRTLTNSLTNLYTGIGVFSDDRYVNRRAPNFAGAAVSNLNMGFKTITNAGSILTVFPVTNTTTRREFVTKVEGVSSDSAIGQPGKNGPIEVINRVITRTSMIDYDLDIPINASFYEISAIAENLYGGSITNSAIISLNPIAAGSAPTKFAYVTVNTNQIKYLADPTAPLDAVNLRTLTNAILALPSSSIAPATVVDLREWNQAGNTGLYISPYILTNILDVRENHATYAIGGSITMTGGVSDGVSSYSPGGTINMNGGARSRSGNINMSGGHPGSFSGYGRHGGDIDTHGSLAAGSGTDLRGGSILTFAHGLVGGNLVTTNGGGTLDTCVGVLELGKNGSRTAIKVAAASPNGTLHLPPVGAMPANSATVMTTRAFTALNMNTNKIVGLTNGDFASPFDAVNVSMLLMISSAMAQAIASATPVGTIAAWGGAGPAPANWLKCEGQLVPTSSYPELFAVISTNFGASADVAPASFNIPDLKGRFPRGVTTDTLRDPDVADRLASNNNGAQKGNVGSLQGDNAPLRQHNHNLDVSTLTHYLPYAGLLATLDKWKNTSGNDTIYSTTENHYFNSTAVQPRPGTSVSGYAIAHKGGAVGYSAISIYDTESRPKNVYVSYIIKYR